MGSLGDELKDRLGARKANTKLILPISDGVMLIMGSVQEREGLPAVGWMCDVCVSCMHDLQPRC